MTDPLAHLYAETGAGDPEDPDLDLPVTEVTLDDLTAVGPGDDHLDAHDLEELVLLVRARIDAGTMDDHQAVELGLGDITTVNDAGEPADPERILNPTGRAVFRRLFADQARDLVMGTCEVCGGRIFRVGDGWLHVHTSHPARPVR